MKIGINLLLPLYNPPFEMLSRPLMLHKCSLFFHS
jgi:hypothetical protein